MAKTTKQKARENLTKRMNAEEGDFKVVRKGKRKRITKKGTKK